MTLGPIEMVVLGFPGSQFNGEILPSILDLVERNVVSIVDALFITKDGDGTTEFIEITEIDDDPEVNRLGAILSSELELLSDEDVEDVADQLAPGASALVLIFEHTWMKPVRQAIIDSGGVLIADIHVPGEVVDEVLAAAAAQG